MSATTNWQPLRDEALRVLKVNDLGGWTRPAPRLYPHQWSWDSAFIAMGLARVDPDRAMCELTSLMRGQWQDGRVPHIVYNPAVPPEAYFPDASRWDCVAVSPVACAEPLTSGICQPPVHALAVRDIVAVAGARPSIRECAESLYPALLRWHRYLASQRDAEGQGLLSIYHPWESGTDNSPRWDGPLEHVVVGRVPPYVRRDLAHVTDTSQRPSNAEYDRYLWLAESLKQAGYDDTNVRRTHPFIIKDVLFSAIFAVACAALAELASWVEADPSEIAEMHALADRFSHGVASTWNDEAKLALDIDVIAGRPVQVQTFAGLAPLLLPGDASGLAREAAERLSSADFAGNPRMRFAVVPSTVPDSPGFRESTYWRGPSWPVMNWLLWWGLRAQRQDEAADQLREANLTLLSQPGAEMAEYFHPYSGAPLGSRHQSWTASAVLSWIDDPAPASLPERAR